MIQSAWRQAWSWGTRLGSHLASQETALTNARRASTQLLRRRVERDEVELYLDDLHDPHDPHDAATAPVGEGAPGLPVALPEQRAARRGTSPRR